MSVTRSHRDYSTKPSRQGINAGFTIIEMIVTIVVSSIMAIGLVSFIGNSIEGIESSANRNQLASAGRIAIDRLAIEIHNSLPNSLRVSTVVAGDQCIEFVPVRATTSYIDPPFAAAGGTTFDVVKFEPDQDGVTGGYAVIHPDNIGRIYDGENATVTGFPFRGPIEEITDIQDSTVNPGVTSEVTLAANHRFRSASPNQRFFITEQPVSYCVKGDKLYRYSNYGFYDTQTAAEEEPGVCEVALGDRCLPNYLSAPDKLLISDSIDNAGLTAFAVDSQSLTENSLVAIVFNLTSGGDVVLLNHDVLTRSVP